MSSCDDIEAKYEAVTEALQTLSAKIADSQDLVALNRKVASLEARHQTLWLYVGDLGRGIKILQGKVADLTSAIAGVRSAIQSLNGGLHAIKTETQTVKATAGNALASAVQAIAAIAVVKPLIPAIKAEAAAAKKLSYEALFRAGDAISATNEIKPFARKIPKIEKEMSGIYQQFGGLDSKIKEVGSRATQASKKATSALSQAASNASGIKGLAGKILGIFNIISTLATIAMLAEQVITNNKQWAEIRELQRKAKQQEEGLISERRERAQGDAAVLGALDRLRRHLEKKITDVRREIDLVVRPIKDSLDRVRVHLEKKITDVRREIDLVIRPIKEALAAGLSALKAEIYSALRSQLGGLESRLSARIEKAFAQIESIIKLIQSIRSDLLRRVEKLEQNLSKKIESIVKLIQSIRSDLLRRIEDLKNWVQNLLKGFNPNIAIGSIAAAAAAIALAQLLSRLPGLIAQHSPKMSCRFNDTAARDAAASAKRGERATNILNTFTQGALFKKVSDGFTGTFTRLGEPLAKGGIGAKLMRLGVVQAADRVMSFLIFFATLHNAMMLSKNVLLTLTETMTVGLDVIQTRLGLKDSEDEPLDVTKAVGQSVNTFMASVLGASRWAELKQSFAAANRILQAGANIIYQVRSLTDSSLTIGQFIGENLAKLMNGLKFSGVVDKLSYPFVSETVNPQSIILQKIQNVGDAADALSSVTSEVKSIQEEAGELGEQSVKFQEMIEKGKKQASDLADAWDDNSLTPQIDPTKDF